MTKILVLYYSTYGHIEAMAESVAAGAREVPETEVSLKRVPDLMGAETLQKIGAKVEESAYGRPGGVTGWPGGRSLMPLTRSAVLKVSVPVAKRNWASAVAYWD